MAPAFTKIIFTTYGVSMMAMLLDVSLADMFVKRRRFTVPYFIGMFILNAAVIVAFGSGVYANVVFIVLHLPTILYFSLVSAYKGIKLAFVFLTAIVFCALPVVSTKILFTNEAQISATNRNFIYVIFCVIILAAMYGFFRPSFLYMLRYGSNKDFSSFILIPLLCGIYFFLASDSGFAITYGPVGLVTQMPVFICVLSYFLLVTVFKRTRDVQLLQNEKDMLLVQRQSTCQQVSQLKIMQEQTAVYRHDLRHHLSLIGSLATEGDMEKIKEYIAATWGAMDTITPKHYCENEMVNLILSSFSNRAKTSQVDLSVEIKLPDKLAFPDTELCAVLSNGIENALTAAAKVEQVELRTVRVDCFVKRDKLMMMIENRYSGAVEMENGIPTSNQDGHGFGCRSIAAIADKRGGNYTFVAAGGVFTLRIILPLEQRDTSNDSGSDKEELHHAMAT